MIKLVLAAALALFILGDATAYATDEQPKVKAVYFYASWCSNCKIVDPILDKARMQTQNLPVQHLTLDFSNAQTWDKAMEIALDNDVVATYNAYAGTTGMVVLLAADTGEQIDCVNRLFTVGTMSLAFERAVERVETLAVGLRDTGSMVCPTGRPAP
ncbi:MAG: thioredoxin family protein [Robiginitomaculum sp.]|nr:thioredoxin family protein [Robiginitomaculum sp.]